MLNYDESVILSHSQPLPLNCLGTSDSSGVHRFTLQNKMAHNILLETQKDILISIHTFNIQLDVGEKHPLMRVNKTFIWKQIPHISH